MREALDGRILRYQGDEAKPRVPYVACTETYVVVKKSFSVYCVMLLAQLWKIVRKKTSSFHKQAYGIHKHNASIELFYFMLFPSNNSIILVWSNYSEMHIHSHNDFFSYPSRKNLREGIT